MAEINHWILRRFNAIIRSKKKRAKTCIAVFLSTYLIYLIYLGTVSFFPFYHTGRVIPASFDYVPQEQLSLQISLPFQNTAAQDVLL